MTMESIDYKHELYEYNGHVVVTKYDKTTFLKSRLVVQSDTSKTYIKVEDLLYSRFQIGDTINVNKTDRGW